MDASTVMLFGNERTMPQEKLIPIKNYVQKLKPLAMEMRQAYGHNQVNDQSIGPKFDQAAYRQATRNRDRDPKERSAFIYNLWQDSKSPDEFVHFMREGGYELAMGNRTRIVLLHQESGEILKGSLGRHLRDPEKGAVRAAELRKWSEGLSTPLEPVTVVQARLKSEQHFDRDLYHAHWLQRVEEEAIRKAKEEEAAKRSQRNVGGGAGKKIPQPRKDFRKPADGYEAYADEIDPLRKWEREAHQKRMALENQLEDVYRLSSMKVDLVKLKAKLIKYEGIKGKGVQRR